MSTQGDRYWRARAGAPRSRGVLVAGLGAPTVVEAAPGAPPTAEEPVRMPRIAPHDALAGLVRHYWIPRWRLPPGRAATQRVLEYPSANLVVEPGTRAAVHGPSIGLAERTLEGEGHAFGVALQPGVAPLLTGRPAREIVGRVVPVPSLDGLSRTVADAVGAGLDHAAVETFERWLAARDLHPSPDARLVRTVIAQAEDDRSIVRVEQLAAFTGVGVRRLERLVREQLGLTPRWLIRRYRLQEAATRLAASDPLDRAGTLADLAAELGYADQAHFTREFRTVIGVPPGRYLREATAGRMDA
ncbi:helix-turn-helix domain-containing protein [Agromyces larvae]|uniref:Helix-turn-helix domain-containing protein n=1 Tax=Agromyces larvae TaxID=2929802 RepID=A0ABY4BZC3_9MICO|nr:helix-turn-helix domain-containing protein [Agromyces larvae]UOE44259.1 helix-turn-helix domain-containing protein [Agromyces larvae]